MRPARAQIGTAPTSAPPSSMGLPERRETNVGASRRQRGRQPQQRARNRSWHMPALPPRLASQARRPGPPRPTSRDTAAAAPACGGGALGLRKTHARSRWSSAAPTDAHGGVRPRGRGLPRGRASRGAISPSKLPTPFLPAGLRAFPGRDFLVHELRAATNKCQHCAVHGGPPRAQWPRQGRAVTAANRASCVRWYAG